MDNRKKLFLIIGAVVIVLIIIALIIPKKGAAPTGFSLEKIVLARGVTESRQPVGATEYFMTSDNEIYAVVTYGLIPADTTIDYQWYDLSSNDILRTDRIDVAKEASGNGVARLAKGGGIDWGRGLYEFRVIKDGDLVARKEYAVKTEIDLEREQYGASLKSVKLATSVDLRGNVSGGTTDVFEAGDKRIYASITYGKLPSPVTMEARWKFVKGDRLINSYKKELLDGGTFAIYIDSTVDSWIPTKKWPTGAYQLEIYFDGDLQNVSYFSVE